MATYLSSLLTSTTSRYNNLRRTLLSDESDGSTEDQSHISRVLRAYYTEKGRPFPEWLPPDSKDQQQQQQYQQQQSQGQYSQSQRPSVQQQPSRRSGGLSDLWDSPSPSVTQSQAPLRTTGRSGLVPAGRPDSFNAPTPQRPGGPSGARPLMNQRDVSDRSGSAPYGGSDLTPTPSMNSAAGGGTAQDRLKARLWGAGKT